MPAGRPNRAFRDYLVRNVPGALPPPVPQTSDLRFYEQNTQLPGPAPMFPSPHVPNLAGLTATPADVARIAALTGSAPAPRRPVPTVAPVDPAVIAALVRLAQQSQRPPAQPQPTPEQAAAVQSYVQQQAQGQPAALPPGTTIPPIPALPAQRQAVGMRAAQRLAEGPEYDPAAEPIDPERVARRARAEQQAIASGLDPAAVRSMDDLALSQQLAMADEPLVDVPGAIKAAPGAVRDVAGDVVDVVTDPGELLHIANEIISYSGDQGAEVVGDLFYGAAIGEPPEWVHGIPLGIKLFNGLRSSFADPATKERVIAAHEQGGGQAVLDAVLAAGTEDMPPLVAAITQIAVRTLIDPALYFPVPAQVGRIVKGALAAGDVSRGARAVRAVGSALELPQRVADVTIDLPFTLLGKGISKAREVIPPVRHLLSRTPESAATGAQQDVGSATDEVLAHRSPGTATISGMTPTTGALPPTGPLGSTVRAASGVPAVGGVSPQPAAAAAAPLPTAASGAAAVGGVPTSTVGGPAPTAATQPVTVGTIDRETGEVTGAPSDTAAGASVPFGRRRRYGVEQDDGTVAYYDTLEEAEVAAGRRPAQGSPVPTPIMRHGAVDADGVVTYYPSEAAARATGGQYLPPADATPTGRQPGPLEQEARAAGVSPANVSRARQADQAWPGEPRPRIRDDGTPEYSGPYPELWRRAKAAPTKDDGLRVFDEYGERLYGPREQAMRPGRRVNRQGQLLPDQPLVYDTTRQGRGWRQIDANKAAFTDAWDQVKGAAPDVTVAPAAAATVRAATATPPATSPAPAPAPPPPAPTTQAPPSPRTPTTPPPRVDFADWDRSPHLSRIRPDRPQVTRTGEPVEGTSIARHVYENVARTDPERATEFLAAWKPLAEAQADDFAEAAARNGWRRYGPEEAISNTRFQAETEIPLLRSILGDEALPVRQWLYGAKWWPGADVGKQVEHAVWGSKETARKALDALVSRGEVNIAKYAVRLHNKYAADYGALSSRLFPDRPRRKGKVLEMLGPNDVPPAVAGDLIPPVSAAGIAMRDPISDLMRRANADYAAWQATIPQPPPVPIRQARPITEPFPGQRTARELLTDPTAPLSPEAQAILDQPFRNHPTYAGKTRRQVWTEFIDQATKDQANVRRLVGRGARVGGRRPIDRQLTDVTKDWEPFGHIGGADPDEIAARRLGFESMVDEGWTPDRRPNVYTLFNQMTSQVLLHSPLTGWAYTFANFLSDLSLTALKYPAALPDMLKGTRTALQRAGHFAGKRAPGVLPAEELAEELLIGRVPRVLMEESAQETLHQRGALRAFLNRIGIGRVRLGTKTLADAAKPWERKAELNRQLEGTRRAGAWRYRTEMLLAEAFESYRPRLAQNAHRIAGLPPEVTSQVLDELPIAFGPQRLHDQVVKAAQAAGASRGRARQLGRVAFQEWTNQVRKSVDQAVKDVDRPMPTFRQTNADRYLRVVVPFFFWHSRATKYVLEEMLHNPAVLTTYARTREELERYEAANPDMPNAVKGMLRAFTSPWGLVYYADPRKLILTAAFFGRESQFEDPTDSWYSRGTDWMREHLGIGVWPVIDWAANVAGLDGDEFSPNPLPIPEQRLIGDAINAGLAMAGYPPGDPIWDRANQWVREKVSGITAQIIPGAESVTAGDPNAPLYDQIDSMILEQNPELLAGMRSEDPDERAAATAEFAEITGDHDDPRYKAAWRAVAGSGFFRDLWNSFSPLKVTTPRIPTRDELIVQAAAGDQTAQDIRGTVTATDEARELDADLAGLEALGTPRQRDLYAEWNTIVYGEEWGGFFLDIGNHRIDGQKLVRMTQDERAMLADAWVAQFGGTQELATYREQREAFLQAHPEAGSFKEYQSFAGDYEGGIRTFRHDMVESHPEFADELAEQEARHRADGKTGEVLEKELDQWVMSPAGFAAFQGERYRVYDENPEDAFDPTSDPYQGAAAKGAAQGGGAGGRSAKTTAQKLNEDLLEYQIKAQQVEAILGVPLDQVDYPMARQALEARFGDALPRVTELMQLYFDWAAFQPAGADTSPEAFARYLDQLEAQQALGLLAAAPSSGQGPYSPYPQGSGR